ncbi:MAG: RDD family protein [Pseudomonadota bacterium]|nr:RDD family protein [Pseudomonadota bacterium]
MEPSQQIDQNTLQKSGLLRRVAAAFYDSLLLLALWMIGTIPIVIVRGGQAVPAGDGLYIFYLLAIAGLFFGGFWTHGGQTLGMRAWRIQLLSNDGQPVTWKRAIIRFAAALLSWASFGLGFLWQWVDRDNMTWHDRLSGTVLVKRPKSWG